MDNIEMYGDTFTEFNIMWVNLREMNLKLVNNYKQRRVCDLFEYLINKGYYKEGADLWENMIKKNFFV
jgi:hypothetical protein